MKLFFWKYLQLHFLSCPLEVTIILNLLLWCYHTLFHCLISYFQYAEKTLYVFLQHSFIPPALYFEVHHFDTCGSSTFHYFIYCYPAFCCVNVIQFICVSFGNRYLALCYSGHSWPFFFWHTCIKCSCRKYF
jgi:hypothetical protein